MRFTSRSAASLLAAALLVAASACGSDSTDTTSPAATGSADTIDEPTATWEPTNGVEPVRVVTSTPVDVSAPFGASVEDPDYVPVRWLVPWDDGFLAAAVRYPSRTLPDQLPPDVAELFPPEVRALFPDGLPSTQREATEILEEAGLLDDVMDVLNEHPEAMDLFQSEPQPAPELVASWTTDGDEWTPVDVTVPDGIGDVSQLTVSGDRLTLAGAAQPEGTDGRWTVTVASTTDLDNWDTASFPIPTAQRQPDEAPPWIAPMAVAADDQHWIVHVLSDTGADPPTSFQDSQWSGTWSGEPTMGEADFRTTMLQSTSDGFLALDEVIDFSPDGQTWTETPALAPGTRVTAAAPWGGDVLAATSNSGGESSFVVIDASGTSVTDLEIPELGNDFQAWGPTSSPAFIVERATLGAQQSNTWLLATTDGKTWLLQDLDDHDADTPPPALVAINDTTVLVGTLAWDPSMTEVWQRFTLTE